MLLHPPPQSLYNQVSGIGFYIDLSTRCKDLVSGIGYNVIVAFLKKKLQFHILTVTFQHLTNTAIYSGLKQAGVGREMLTLDRHGWD